MSFWGKGRLAARTVAGLALLAMGSAVQAGVIGFESGNIVLNNTLNVPEFTSVSFAQSYDQAPLVFALASNQGSHPSALRVRNVSRDGFEIAQLEPDNLDGGHLSMAIDYFAITPGSHDLGNGLVFEAGSLLTDTTIARSGGSYDAITFANGFVSAPALLTQIQTMNSEAGAPPVSTSSPWLVSSATSLTATGAELALDRTEVSDGGTVLPEQLGYVAISAGLYDLSDILGNDITVASLLSDANIFGWDDTAGVTSGSTVSFNAGFSTAPRVVASLVTRNGNNGGWLRRGAISATGIALAVDEDQFRDSERNHIGERAGVLAFSDSFAWAQPSPSFGSGVVGSSAVPISSTLWLLLMACVGLLWLRRWQDSGSQ